jgi:formamidopyrimidine-DNA glycosylase
MAELPEIEVTRQRLDPKVLDRPVSAVASLDRKALLDTRAGDLESALQGARFTAVDRFGEWLLLELDGKHALVIRPGATGTIRLVRPKEEPQRDTRLQLTFLDAAGLALDDPRRNARVALITELTSLPDVGGPFGPDPLVSPPDSEHWQAALSKRRAQIKAVLLDPEVVAGLGPESADEVLFQAGIRPDRKAKDLSAEEGEHLRQRLAETLTKAVQCQARPDQMPKGYLTRQRHEDAGVCPACGGKLSRKRIKGRPSLFCPACQQ